MHKNLACTLFLVRHGETEWNKKGLMQGHTDIALSEAGKQQAYALAESFNHLAFDGLISSDLMRAQQTALILAKGRNLPLQTSAALRERFFGKYEGENFRAFKELSGNNFDVYDADRRHLLPGVETYRQAVQRVEPFLLASATTFLGKTLLVVTHGGVLKALLFHLELSQFYKAYFENLGYLKLECDGKKLDFIEAQGLIARD